MQFTFHKEKKCKNAQCRLWTGDITNFLLTQNSNAAWTSLNRCSVPVASPFPSSCPQQSFRHRSIVVRACLQSRNGDIEESIGTIINRGPPPRPEHSTERDCYLSTQMLGGLYLERRGGEYPRRAFIRKVGHVVFSQFARRNAQSYR